jgi:type II secretory pathway component PulC
VTYVKPGSIIEEIGIIRGDIVTYINKVSIMDSVKIMKMLSKARDLKHFNVSIIRDGEKRELNYEIY